MAVHKGGQVLGLSSILTLTLKYSKVDGKEKKPPGNTQICLNNWSAWPWANCYAVNISTGYKVHTSQCSRQISFDEKLLGSQCCIANLALGNTDCNADKVNTVCLEIVYLFFFVIYLFAHPPYYHMRPNVKKMIIKICLLMVNIHYKVWNAMISLPLRDVAVLFIINYMLFKTLRSVRYLKQFLWSWHQLNASRLHWW